MSGGFEALREGIASLLRENGVNAVLTMSPKPARRWREAAAAISVKKIRCVDSGFQNYLGSEIKDSKAKELYGRAADITLAVDIYAPGDGGESACQTALERIAEILLTCGAAGLEVSELTAGQTEWLDREGMYRLRADCLCRVWLTVAADQEDGGYFTDFEVKGRRT